MPKCETLMVDRGKRIEDIEGLIAHLKTIRIRLD